MDPKEVEANLLEKYSKPASPVESNDVEQELLRKYLVKEGERTRGAPSVQPATGLEEDLEPGEQTNVVDRLAVGTNISPEGMIATIRKRGYHARMNPDGSIRYMAPGDRKWRLWDGKDFNVLDIADISGDIGETVVSALGGSLFGPAGAVGGAVAGNVGRQAISDDPYTPEERVGSAVGSGALALAGEKAVDLATAGIRAIRPKRALGKHLDRRRDTEAGRVGQRVEQTTGLGLTPAQRAGSTQVAQLEQVARSSPLYADRAEELYQGQLKAGLEKLDREMMRASGLRVFGGDGRRNATNHLWGINKAAKETIRIIKDTRKNDWKASIDEATRLTGSVDVIDATPVIARLDEIIKNADAPGMGGSLQARRLAAERMKQALEQNGGRINLTQWNNYMAQFRAIADGKGSFADGALPGAEAGIAKRLTHALNQSMDDFIDSNLFGEAGTIMRNARDRWGAHSEMLSDLVDSKLGQALGFNLQGGKLTVLWDDPEKMARVLGQMTKEQVKAATDALRAVDPDIAQKIKGALFEDMIRRGGASVRTGLPDELVPDINPRKLAASMKETPMWDLMDVAERRMFIDMTVYFERIAKGKGEIFQSGSVLDNARRVGSIIAGYPDPGLLKELATGYFATGKVMKLMEDSVARGHAWRVAYDMGKHGKFTERTAKSLAYLTGSGILAGHAKEGSQSEQPQPRTDQPQ